MKRRTLWNGVSAALTLGAVALSGAEPVRLQEAFPLGVYWPYEHVASNSEQAGIPRLEYVTRVFRTLKEQNIDTVWVVNGPGEETDRVLELADAQKIKLLLHPSLGFFYNGLPGTPVEKIEDWARESAAKLGESPAFLGYILKDEPRLCSVQIIDYMHRALQRHDPHRRDSTVVAMTPQTQTFLEDSSLPVLCTDVYHFGGDKSPYIPHPARSSRGQYRSACEGAARIAERNGKHIWIMPQSFTEIWGPSYYEGTRHIVDQGAYIHWRMPTAAETRWQAWEAVRSGAKGVLFFMLDPGRARTRESIQPGGADYKKYQKMLTWAKPKLNPRMVEPARREVDRATALLFPGGEPTPQMLALGKAFGKIRSARTHLLNARFAEFPAFFPMDPMVKANTFRNGDAPERIGVLVNDDPEKPRTFVLRVPGTVAELREPGAANPLPRRADGAYDLTLDPGDGMVLIAKFAPPGPGILFFREDFSRASGKVVRDAANSVVSPFGNFNILGAHAIRLAANGDRNKPVFSLMNLTNPKSANNTVLMNLNRRSAPKGKILLWLTGMPNNCEIRAVADAAAKSAVTDTAHTGKKDQAAAPGPNARTIWKQTGGRLIPGNGDPNLAPVGDGGGMMRPVEIPVGTTSLEFYLGDPKSYLNELLIWFEPETGTAAAR